MRIPEHRRTLAQQVKKLLVLLLVMIIGYMTGSILILQNIREQTIQEMGQMSELYTNELDDRFLRISRSLFSTIVKKNQPDSVFWKYVGQMESGSLDYDYCIVKLREHYLSSAWEYGEEYRIFLYLEAENKYYQLSLTADGGYTASEELENAIQEQVKVLGNTPYAIKKKWNILTCNGETYICKIAQNGNVNLGCYVNVKSILEPFSNITMGDNGFVRLVDGQNHIVGMITNEGITNPDTVLYEKGWYSIQRELKQAPFVIQMRISGEDLISGMTGNILVLCIVGILLIAAGAIMLSYLRKNILLPVQQFVHGLEKYDDHSYTFNLTESNLLELEQIDDKFRHMIHQIRRLKITLYEQELEKQKIEMDYLKLQIRPHFYLNCLNFIHSMIQSEQYPNAMCMSKITADYLTYIFRNTQEMVPIVAETKHCKDYLEILLLRYPQCFEYYIEVHEEVKDALIFPFLIQVFVENAAKHALVLEEKILISVTAYPEDQEDQEYVNIFISDTGKGFPTDVLEKLQRSEDISEDGHHVGIINCLKRFRYYYQDKGEIHFENSPLGGAIIDIHLPLIKKDGEGDI